jgi:hypothetical protein
MWWISSSFNEIFESNKIQIALVLQLFVQQLDLLLVLPCLSIQIIASLLEQVLVFANTLFLLNDASLGEESKRKRCSQSPAMIDTT